MALLFCDVKIRWFCYTSSRKLAGDPEARPGGGFCDVQKS